MWAGYIPTSSARKQTSASASGALLRLLLELVEGLTFFFFTEIARVGELNSDELERLVTVIQNPTQFKIPLWLLNRWRDIVRRQELSNPVERRVFEVA